MGLIYGLLWSCRPGVSSVHADDSQPSSRVILSAEDAADEYEDEEDECDLEDDDGYDPLLVLWLAIQAMSCVSAVLQAPWSSG